MTTTLALPAVGNNGRHPTSTVVGAPTELRPDNRQPAVLTVAVRPVVVVPAVAAVGQRDPLVGEALLAGFNALRPGDPARPAIRAQAIEWYLPMAAQLARRFVGRGEPWGDLNQVANIGLIKAVDRYDPGRGGTFAGYAVPTILGEIKRHFRDFTWTVRVSRRLQEARIQLVRADEEVTRRVQRSPTTAELAVAIGVEPADVEDARQAGSAYRPLTAQRLAPDGEILSVLDTIGALDPGFESVERRMMLRLLLAGASDQDRGLIGMRFADGLTQGEIATRIGVSQMQVSRLLAQLLTRLHDQMVGAPDSGWTARTPAVRRSRGITPRG